MHISVAAVLAASERVELSAAHGGQLRSGEMDICVDVK